MLTKYAHFVYRKRPESGRFFYGVRVCLEFGQEMELLMRMQVYLIQRQQELVHMLLVILLEIRQVIVEKHTGSLTVQSEIGEGTEFFIRLPI